ncbi:hypothetical protein DBN64_15305 [Enterococcus faecalis]|nr:hypothetical protein [Enterococcus faecalis]NRE19484.1 hypothetical protein [Enterococcus faecalis]
MYFYHKIYHRFAVLFTYLRLSKMTKQLFNAYCMMFLFLKLLRNFQIETEYLVDYYYKIGNADKEGNFFASLLRNKVCKQKQLRFGIFPERVII